MTKPSLSDRPSLVDRFGAMTLIISTAFLGGAVFAWAAIQTFGG